MLIKSSENIIQSSEITDREVYQSRRTFLLNVTAASVSLATGSLIAPGDEEIRKTILTLNKNKAPITIRIKLQTKKDMTLHTEVTAKQVDKPILKDAMLFVIVYGNCAHHPGQYYRHVV